MDDRSEIDSGDRYACDDCNVLVEALRDAEKQCREAEDERLQHARTTKSFEAILTEEQQFLAKIKKLEHRRDCALEVLAKHQRLEHVR